MWGGQLAAPGRVRLIRCLRHFNLSFRATSHTELSGILGIPPRYPSDLEEDKPKRGDPSVRGLCI